MNYKLKHLSKYCCKPANELEFEALKMATEIGGLKVDKYFSFHEIGKFPFVSMADDEVGMYNHEDEETEIPVLDFCNKLRMTEKEAEKLEDDRVVILISGKAKFDFVDEYKTMKIKEGYIAKTNEDGTEVTLHKRESC